MPDLDWVVVRRLVATLDKPRMAPVRWLSQLKRSVSTVAQRPGEQQTIARFARPAPLAHVEPLAVLGQAAGTLSRQPDPVPDTEDEGPGGGHARAPAMASRADAGTGDQHNLASARLGGDRLHTQRLAPHDKGRASDPGPAAKRPLPAQASRTLNERQLTGLAARPGQTQGNGQQWSSGQLVSGQAEGGNRWPVTHGDRASRPSTVKRKSPAPGPAEAGPELLRRLLQSPKAASQAGEDRDAAADARSNRLSNIPQAVLMRALKQRLDANIPPDVTRQQLSVMAATPVAQPTKAVKGHSDYMRQSASSRLAGSAGQSDQAANRLPARETTRAEDRVAAASQTSSVAAEPSGMALLRQALSRANGSSSTSVPQPADGAQQAEAQRVLAKDEQQDASQAGAAPSPRSGSPPTVQNTFNVKVHMEGGIEGNEEELAERLNRILVEQARRYGIDV